MRLQNVESGMSNTTDIETLLSEYDLSESDLEHVAQSDYPLASVASTLLAQLFALLFQ